MITFVVAIALIGAARPVEAGLISFFDSLFGDDKEVRTGLVHIEENSQNMDLLSAALTADPSKAQGGPEVIIEDDALVSALAPDGSSPVEARLTNDAITTYIVQEGDTISAIAKMFDVKTNTILWANGIRYGHLIRPGQELVILPIDGIPHKVKKGDTLATIAKSYKGDLGEIADFNELPRNAVLAVGTEVIIPNGIDPNATKAISAGSGVRSSRGVATPGGIFIKPVAGGRKTQGPHGRGGRAIDFGAPMGTPVRAAASGKVILSRSGWNGGYGNYIVIEHPEISSQTLYSHLSTRHVTAGTWVRQGDTIGSVGNTGKSTGPHVHFEVRGKYSNPF